MSKSEKAFRTITEVAVILELPAHVLRFWESKFKYIKPMKRGGGRRYYRPEDIDLLLGIKYLLYSDGMTIKGAQKFIQTNGVKATAKLSLKKGLDEQGPKLKIGAKLYQHAKLSERANINSTNSLIAKNGNFQELEIIMSRLKDIGERIKARTTKKVVA